MRSLFPRVSALPSAPAPAATEAEQFAAHLSATYQLSAQGNYVFGSPLGPFYSHQRHGYLHRFVFFGPHATDDSWRLSFLAGFDRRDLRASRALLALIETLADQVEDGHGLNLTFFPQVDAAAAPANAAPRLLDQAHWSRSAAPEIDLLEKDARLRGYHGFVRLETTTAEDDLITLRVREPAGLEESPDVELISTEETGAYPVRFERAAGPAVADGPLTIAEDLPVQPFELTLRIPAAWPETRYRAAAVTILSRFIRRYRAFQAYGQHL